MAEDWAADVKKYVANADDTVIAAIVRYCGIALRNRDSSLVSMTDPAETGRVRENFLKKKLGLTDPDATLDAAIAAVGERMKGDRTKNRVTVYYLLLDHLGLLHMFRKDGGVPADAALGTAGAAAAVLGAAAIPAEAMGAPVAPVVDAVPVTPAIDPVPVDPAPVGAPPAPVIDPAPVAPRTLASDYGGDRKMGLAWLLWLMLGLLLLLLLWLLFLRHPAPASTAVETGNAAAIAAPVEPVADNAMDLATAPAEGQVAIPEGAGVTVETRDGKPVVKVYFATGKADIAPALTRAATALNGWLSAHPGGTLAVSGYNDKTGNAAANATLSKTRAQAVAAALKAAGIADAAVALVKPADTTDTTTTNAEARRVEVVVK